MTGRGLGGLAPPHAVLGGPPTRSPERAGDLLQAPRPPTSQRPGWGLGLMQISRSPSRSEEHANSRRSRKPHGQNFPHKDPDLRKESRTLSPEATQGGLSPQAQENAFLRPDSGGGSEGSTEVVLLRQPSSLKSPPIYNFFW